MPNTAPELAPAIAAYIAAANARDSSAVTRFFAEDATVFDEGRQRVGTRDIALWMADCAQRYQPRLQVQAVQQRTGAEVAIAAGAEQEKVVVEIADGPAPEVLARLLNGSKFNFLIMSGANDPRKLDRVILTARSEGGVQPLPPVQNEDAEDEAPQPPAPVQSVPAHTGPPPPIVPNSPPENKAPADDNTPDQ